MDHYQFLFEEIKKDQQELLIALLGDIGFSGFEEVDNDLKAFIEEDKFAEERFEIIIKTMSLNYSRSTIKPVNWNEIWEKGFNPVMVMHPILKTPFAMVRANFHEAKDKLLHDIIITPKMSFGTGHHATTYLIMSQMALLDFQDKTVIDFGTGTAVLAILAEKLGAAKVTAIDNDDWSINNANENIAANHCSKIELVKAASIQVSPKADIILANINLNIIVASLDEIKQACKPGANILFSGILEADMQRISDQLINKNFMISGHFVQDNWLAILARV